MSAGSVCRLGPGESACLDSAVENLVSAMVLLSWGQAKKKGTCQLAFQKPTLCQGVDHRVWICPHSDLVGRQSGALKTCHVREETEIDSSILSQELRTSCYKTGSEFSPLGRSARLLENARSC